MLRVLLDILARETAMARRQPPSEPTERESNPVIEAQRQVSKRPKQPYHGADFPMRAAFSAWGKLHFLLKSVILFFAIVFYSHAADFVCGNFFD